MAKKNYYAIKIGYTPNIIVESWHECWKLTNGYAGAIFKGFTCYQQAVDFLALRKAKWDKSKAPLKPVKAKKRRPRYYTKNGIRYAGYGITVGINYTGNAESGVPWD